jgi:dihydrofolate reductase
MQYATRHADASTTMRNDMARANLDRHAAHSVAAFLAGMAIWLTPTAGRSCARSPVRARSREVSGRGKYRVDLLTILLGVGGLQLHQWHFRADEPGYDADAALRDDLLAPKGAYVMGRNMFGPIRGEWVGQWRGWWGEEPPYHAPIFVLTHYAHDPIQMAGRTTFYVVTGGFDAALDQAKAAAGDRNVDIAGGPRRSDRLLRPARSTNSPSTSSRSSSAAASASSMA